MITLTTEKVLETSKEVAKDMVSEFRLDNDIDKAKRDPKLVIITATNDKASLRYVENKKKLAKDFGIEVDHISFDEEVTLEDIEEKINSLNNDPNVDGVILQLPIYDKFTSEEEHRLLNDINFIKDVDGLTSISKGLLEENKPIYVPCTALGIALLLCEYDLESLEGKNAVVIGRGKTSGAPIGVMLRHFDANVTMLHSKTSKKDLEFYVKNADIIISCVGKRHLIDSTWFKEDSIAIGVGFEYDENGKQHLDFEVDEAIALNKAKAVSNRVNCTGKATVIALMLNTIQSYCFREEL